MPEQIKVICGLRLCCFAIGTFLLFLGILFYAVIRPYENDYYDFLTSLGCGTFCSLQKIFYGGLPTFFHTASFSLISMSLVDNTLKNKIVCSSTWVIINIIFELGQLYKPLINKMATGFYPMDFILVEVSNYFVQGTFDIGDILAAICGGFVALFIANVTMTRNRPVTS